jgi:hypothetical protein
MYAYGELPLWHHVIIMCCNVGILKGLHASTPVYLPYLSRDHIYVPFDFVTDRKVHDEARRVLDMSVSPNNKRYCQGVSNHEVASIYKPDYNHCSGYGSSKYWKTTL